MRKVLLLSPHFLPGNVAGVHRVRLMSGHLVSFGWEPTIITVDASCYEELSDPSLAHLIPDAVPVEKVGAWSARVCRALGIGDVSLRAQWQLRRRIGQLIERIRPDAIFATILPGYTALAGSWAKRRYNIPFVLDYQDPWVVSRSERPPWNKSGIAMRVAEIFEPRILPNVDALTAVSEETLASLRERGLIRSNLPIEIIPIGADRRDHEVAARHGQSLIARQGDSFHIAYVGSLTKRMLPALRAFFSASAAASAQTSRHICVHLIGTSARAGGEDTYNLQELARDAGVAASIHLHPARVSYLDALRTMQDADLLFLIGSTDAHYTASKFFPYWLSEKPILGLFHRRSTIVDLSEELGGAKLVLYDEENGPETRIEETSALLLGFSNGDIAVPSRHEAAFAPYSAEGTAARYAGLFDKIARP